MKKVLAVDDQPPIVRLIQINLQKAGFEVVTAFDGEEGLQKVRDERPDLVILDVIMPKLDGFEVLRAIKTNPETRNIPVIMLTVKAQDADIFEGLKEGAELYLPKPFHPTELEARLRHLFWRTGTGSRPELVEYGPLVLNLETYQAAIDAHPVDLTYMEYELLKFLAQHPGRVFTRETLLSRVWGYEYYGGARTVDVHIRRLRAKLCDEHAGLISTVRSVGYRFGQSRWG